MPSFNALNYCVIVKKKFKKFQKNHYYKIMELVENGHSVISALKKLNIRSQDFYSNISQQQKIELQMIKTTNCKIYLNELFNAEF